LTKVPIIKNALDLLNKEFKGFLIKIPLIHLPESTNPVWFVYLWGDRLYTEADETLYVYSFSDLNSPSATYPLGNKCYSALITDSRLYLGVAYKLLIFEVTPSLTEPLKPVTKIPTKDCVFKILRVGDDLLLG
jgi:hypothetical protein